MGNLLDLFATGFNPKAIPSLVGWYDFTDSSTLFTDTARTTPVSADGNSIAGVTDKSGLSNHLAQATGAAQPTYKVGILNGHSVARFDGGDNLAVTYGVALSQPGTVFLVGTNTDRAADSWAFSATNGAPGWIIFRINGATDHWGMYSGSTLTGAATADASAHIWAATYNNLSSKMYTDGGTADASGGAGANTTTAASLGANTTPLNGIIGDISEVYVYNAAVSLANTNLLGASLGRKHGLTWTTAV